MIVRKRYLPLLAAAGLGALLIGGTVHGQAPTTASIVASDFAFKTSGGAAPSVTIAPGGTVAFSYPSGANRHNVAFTAAQPTSCAQTAGSASTGAVPPLPNPAGAPGWAGECTFASAGTYAFVCDLHASMTGSVTVTAAVGTTTPPPPPQPRPTSTRPAASALRLAGVQRGSAIRGSVEVTGAGSRLLARAFARRKALYGGRSGLQVEVGRHLRRSVGGGRVAFTVRVNPVARRALRRNGRLAISLRLTATPATGAAYTATRTVILRPA